MDHRAAVKWEDAYSIIDSQINAQMVHLWRFFPQCPIDVRFLEFGRERDIRSNRHDYFEILYLCSGEVVYEVQGRPLPMNEGDLFIVGSTQFHKMGAYVRIPVTCAVLYFLPELIRGSEGRVDDIEYLMPFLVQDDGFAHVIPAQTGIPAEVFELMQRTSRELPAATPRARLTAKTYLKMMLMLLVNYYAAIRGSEEIFDRKQRELERMAPLFEYVDRSFASPITVEQAAAIMRMSKSSFSRFFKRLTGQPFVTYLNHFRVAKAQMLLTTTDKSIAEVGQEVGYCDQSYFGLVFRSVTGLSPRDYKEQGKASHA